MRREPTEVAYVEGYSCICAYSTSDHAAGSPRLHWLRKHGIDYHFAYTQAALSLQQNVTLPGNLQPSIQQSSLVGEVYRYRVVGPSHFGPTNLRTVQDWVALRGLSTVPGVVQVNS